MYHCAISYTLSGASVSDSPPPGSPREEVLGFGTPRLPCLQEGRGRGWMTHRPSAHPAKGLMGDLLSSQGSRPSIGCWRPGGEKARGQPEPQVCPHVQGLLGEASSCLDWTGSGAQAECGAWESC